MTTTTTAKSCHRARAATILRTLAIAILAAIGLALLLSLSGCAGVRTVSIQTRNLTITNLASNDVSIKATPLP